MTRSGYSDDYDFSEWNMICWRGAVASAIKGKRGQKLLQEMLAAFDAMESKRLIADDLIDNKGEVCALGAVGKMRGLNMDDIDPEDRETVAKAFDIAPALAAEITYMNDEYIDWNASPETRFMKMRQWVEKQIKKNAN